MKVNSRLLWAFWGLLLLGNVGILGYGACLPTRAHYAQKRAVANRYLLTDYCLSTESRHVRHIALPEPIAPFQDLPAYHEHFPSSSFFWSKDLMRVAR
ncbi:MAG: hypothetical protein EAZ95_03930 [Bacteroidetes bacterium]|nr:MAG: hypothetical protein EAZ95_03930 [Bacteroidota bacterium]